MKFAIGYQQTDNGEPFHEIVRDYRDSIAEVYFPWPGTATGRAALGKVNGAVDWFAQQELESELHEIRASGVKLDLLWNANCYGAHAISSRFKNEICSILLFLKSQELLPEIITTTSLFVAHVIRENFPGIEIRASVNMRIDSTLAMDYLGDSFDSFHIRRDLQRDLKTVQVFHEWCRMHNKKLCMLVNSGCLRNCPGQSFHDNLVAHDAEIDEIRNEKFIPHLCWKLFRDKKNYVEFLRASWIRPEDLSLYEPYFSVVKLATRQHSHPRMVIGAYVSQQFRGNLLDILEPAFSPAFAPYAIDNSKFPADWTSIAGRCATNCSHCGKCEQVLAQVLTKQTGIGFPL